MTATGKMVSGHRRCPRCRYRMTGQPIIRDEDLGIFIIRCPECGTVLPTSDIGVLGGWTRVATFGLAAVWVLLTVKLWIAGGGALFGLSLGTAYSATADYQQEIDTIYRKQHEDAKLALGSRLARGVSVPAGGAVQTFPVWWAAQDKAAMLESMGGWREVTQWVAFIIWIPLGLIAVLFGCVWSVVLHRRSIPGRLLLLPLLIAPTVVFAIRLSLEWSRREITWTHDAALHELGAPFLLGSVGYTALCMGVGLVIGGSVCRGLCRLTIPPACRLSITPLWTAAGKEPPFEIATD